MRASGRWSSEVDPCENWLMEEGKWIALDNGGPSLGWANGADSYEHCQVEKIRLDWMVTGPAGFNVGMTDRCGPAGAADLLIGENGTQLDSPYVVSYEASERVQYVTAAQ